VSEREIVPTVDLDGDANGEKAVYFRFKELVVALAVFSIMLVGSRIREDNDEGEVIFDEERRKGEYVLNNTVFAVRR
jgi:hypothetical protein